MENEYSNVLKKINNKSGLALYLLKVKNTGVIKDKISQIEEIISKSKSIIDKNTKYLEEIHKTKYIDRNQLNNIYDVYQDINNAVTKLNDSVITIRDSKLFLSEKECVDFENKKIELDRSLSQLNNLSLDFDEIISIENYNKECLEVSSIDTLNNAISAKPFTNCFSAPLSGHRNPESEMINSPFVQHMDTNR